MMENLLDNDKAFGETLDTGKLIDARVLSKEGYVLGRISEIRIK